MISFPPSTEDTTNYSMCCNKCVLNPQTNHNREKATRRFNVVPSRLTYIHKKGKKENPLITKGRDYRSPHSPKSPNETLKRNPRFSYKEERELFLFLSFFSVFSDLNLLQVLFHIHSKSGPQVKRVRFGSTTEWVSSLGIES